MQFSTFKSWDEVLSAARSGESLWYHAPMDLLPCAIRVKRVYKNRKIRIEAWSRDLSFTADAGHLNRFRAL